jgi:hypothetical protein
VSRVEVAVSPSTDTAPRTGLRRTLLAGRYRLDFVFYLVYLLGGLFVPARLWMDPHHRVLTSNPTDQSQFDWFLAHGAWWVTHGGNPLFSTRMNVPSGVNLMANTSVLGLTVPLSPITLAFGPDVAFALLLTLAFAATAGCWYWVLSRTLVPNRLAAFVAAGVCGFAPGLVSHGAGQPNFVAQFLVPLIIYHATRLAKPGRLLPRAAVLAALIVWQTFINEEVLLFLALGSATMLVVMAAFQRQEVRQVARRVAPGLLLAGALTLVVLAYPLWFQFRGPQTYRGLPFDPSAYYTDPATYFTFSRESLAGSGGVAPRFVKSASEENGFFGFPLLVLVGILAGWMWREKIIVRAATITAVVFAVLATGARLTIHGVSTGLPGPFVVVQHIPVIDLITPTRFTLVMIPLIALLLGLGIQRVGQLAPATGSLRTSWFALWALACVAALLPIAPTPLSSGVRGPVPAFFTSGQWRQYVPDGRTVVSVPLAANVTPDSLWWAANTTLAVTIPRGYFLGPTSPTNKQAIFGAPPRPTSTLLKQVYDSGKPASVGAADRAAALQDLTYWRAAVLVLAPGRSDVPLRQTVTDLVGREPIFTGGVWVWTVNP